jgi:hypothetical protein
MGSAPLLFYCRPVGVGLVAAWTARLTWFSRQAEPLRLPTEREIHPRESDRLREGIDWRAVTDKQRFIVRRRS